MEIGYGGGTSNAELGMRKAEGEMWRILNVNFGFRIVDWQEQRTKRQDPQEILPLLEVCIEMGD